MNFEKNRFKNEPSSNNFFVDSISAIKEYATFNPDVLVRIYFRSTVSNKLSEILSLLNRKIETIKIDDLSPDQIPIPIKVSLFAEIKLQSIDEKQFQYKLKKVKSDLILCLDHIQDPRNLGAIVRSAAFFKVKTILVPKDRQVLLTHASVSTAQGGFALVDVVEVVNLSRTLSSLKNEGYWIIGAEMTGEPFRKVAGFYKNVVLILGSEESGLSQNVRKLCDRFVAIGQNSGGIESLNVSVAAGILLEAFTFKT